MIMDKNKRTAWGKRLSTFFLIAAAALLNGCGKGKCPLTVYPDGVTFNGSPVYAKMNVVNTSSSEVTVEKVTINGEWNCTDSQSKPLQTVTLSPGDALYAWCAGYSAKNPGKPIVLVEVDTSDTTWRFDME